MSDQIQDPKIREQLERILASSGFKASERMGRLLRFAVSAALEGRGGELKEYLLGVEVFDRTDTFDPRIDPIVRVEARRLRAKLRAFYEAEGRNDELIIEFPTGTYAPRFRTRRETMPECPQTAPPTRIVVLPFKNLNPDAGTDYFSDGLTEELIHALTQTEGLQVVAWNSAAQLKDRQDDFQGIGSQLNVGAVLHGTVRRSGDRVRIVAKLVDAKSGDYLWSETYDRRIEDLFAIQEEISKAIAASLRLKFFGTRGAWNVEAYDLYLRGRFCWNKRTPDGLVRAMQYFSEAIAIDPNFAPGYAGLSDAYSLHADYGIHAAAEMMPKAKAAALRALEADPNLAEPYASLGFITSLYEWRWPEAGEYYRKAIKLNPGYVTAHHWYAVDYLSLMGRFDEALEEVRLAAHLDPLSSIGNEGVGYVLMCARRYDEALEQQFRNMELDPTFYKFYASVGRLYIQKRMFKDAIEMLEKARSLAGDVPSIISALAQALALRGDRDLALQTETHLRDLARTRYVPATSFALVRVTLGEPDQALDLLEAACDRRELTVSVLKVHPAYDPLRGEARFESLLKRIGLKP